MSSTIIFKNCLETVKRLNADIGTIQSNAPVNTAGTYALINQIISDLSSIKASLKAQEKIISDQCSTLTVGNDIDTTVAITHGSMTASTLLSTSGLGSNDNNDRYSDPNSANKLPAVLTNGTDKYSESAVFTTLAIAFELIDKLKNGSLGSGNITPAVAASLAAS
jgi:hypothetical protein